MNAKAALCMALLEGRVLNVKNVPKLIGLTNCAREISRMIEEPFGVSVSRTQKSGKSRYGTEVRWTDYRLNHTEYNGPGIQKMKEYVLAHRGSLESCTTDTEYKNHKQQSLFLNTP